MRDHGLTTVRKQSVGVGMGFEEQAVEAGRASRRLSAITAQVLVKVAYSEDGWSWEVQDVV